jgi:hypothetical protein
MSATVVVKDENPVLAAVDAGHYQISDERLGLRCRACREKWPCAVIIEARAKSATRARRP